MTKTKKAPRHDNTGEQTPTTATVETINVPAPSSLTLTHGDHITLGVSELLSRPLAVAYLLQYGFTQSLQDSVAGLGKAVREEKGEDGEPKYTTDAEIAAEVLARTNAKQTARLASILDGSIGTRGNGGGARVSPIEKTMSAIALEEYRAAVAAHNVANPGNKLTIPTGDVLRDQLGQYMAAHDQRLREKAAQRIAEAKANADAAGSLIAGLIKAPSMPEGEGSTTSA